MEQPLVSVIIPVYNREKTVERAVRSVLDQTWTRLEVIVVNDGSTDRTADVLAAIEDPRLTVVTNPENLGGSGSRNAGIRISRGKFIAFQDSDDEWLPEKLMVQMNVLMNSSADYGVVYSRELIIAGDGKREFPDPQTKAQRVIRGDVYRELLKGNFVPMVVGVVKRDCLDASGVFDEKMPRFQDWELWIRIARRFRFIFVDQCFAHVHVTPGSISSSQQAHALALEMILEKYRDDISRERSLLAWYYHQLGVSFLRSAASARARRYFRLEFQLRPSLVGALYLLSTWLPPSTVPELKRLAKRFISHQTGPDIAS